MTLQKAMRRIAKSDCLPVIAFYHSSAILDMLGFEHFEQKNEGKMNFRVIYA